MERSGGGGGRLGRGGHMMSHHSGSGGSQNTAGESGSGVNEHTHHAVYSHAQKVQQPESN